MRYVLMTEPQQGMSYADQLAAAKRAEANGFDAYFRADHFASFPGPAGQPTTDAWTDPRRPRPRDPAHRPWRPRVAGDVPPSRCVREGRDDRRRDERRPDRGRRRRGLERRSSTSSSASRSRRSRSGPTSWRTSWRSSTGCGASPMAGRTRASPGSSSRARSSGRARSTSRAGRGRRSAALGRGSSSAARARRGRSASPRATRTSST